MYPPKYHQAKDFEKIREVITKYPLATLISVKNEECLISHIPLIHKEEKEGFGKLLGHIDRNNPQVELLNNQKIQVIFSTPDAYISPNDYSTEQFPTWNYVKVHLKGKVKQINSPEKIKNILIRSTETFEKDDKPFVLEPNHPRMNQLLKFIIGFEIEILEWEGKFKLSQDKIPEDIEKAKQKLMLNTQESIKGLLNNLLLG